MSSLVPSLDGAPPPPDSWPGAGGLRSIAPEVPSWADAPASREAPGGGWPGASSRASGAAGSAASTHATLATETTRGAGDGVPGGVAAVLFPGLVGIVLLAVAGVWASFDDEHRGAQTVALLLIVVAAMGTMIAAAWRVRR